MKKDGLGMIAGIRLFALCVCVILVLSGVRIATSVKEYINNDSLPDVYGIQTQRYLIIQQDLHI